MIGGQHQQGVGETLLEFEANLDRLIEGHQLPHGRGDVTSVTCVIHPPTLDLQQEVRFATELIERAPGHVREGRDLALELRVMIAVEGEGQVTRGEGAQPRTIVRGVGERGGVLADRVAAIAKGTVQVDLVLALRCLEELPAPAQQHFDASVEILLRNVLGVPRLEMVAAKPAGVAWVISVVVTNPRFQPASLNRGISGRSSRPSGRTFNAPLTTRDPLPQLEEAAAESVTNELSDRMSTAVTVASSRCNSSNQRKPRCRRSWEKAFPIVNVLQHMPSATR